MTYYGSWKIDDLLTFYANTHRFDTGAATDADAVPSYRVYEDETTTPLLTGNMALIDSANTAGFYSEQITLSAANGFEKGKSYSIYIAATVNSVAGATHHNFQIEAEVDSNSVSNIGSGVITATAIAADAIGASELAADAASEIAAAVWDLDATAHQTGGTFGQAIGDPGADTNTIFKAVVTDAAGATVGVDTTAIVDDTGTSGVAIATGAIATTTFAAGAIDAAAIAADAIGASELAAGAVDEILDDTIGDGTLTVRQALRVLVAGMAGKLSGAATTTITIRNAADSADVIVATVDADGNRSAVTVTP